MKSLPLSVVSGYLGAGKTTLINRLLSEDHGKRLMVLVNDFGAINIDAKLLISADEDTLMLSNGCVCCTMGADLFMAIDKVLKRQPRPEHLVIEASGVANPAQIAQAAITEPELSYGGILTVVDALHYPRQQGDVLIGSQVREQVKHADLLLISKQQEHSEPLHKLLRQDSRTSILCLDDMDTIAPLVFGIKTSKDAISNFASHPEYLSWSYTGDLTMSYQKIRETLAKRPNGLYRLKGFIREDSETCWQVQIVGRVVEIIRTVPHQESLLVGIGPKDSTSREEIDCWAKNLGITGQNS